MTLKTLPLYAALLLAPGVLHADVTRSLHDGWQLQSACSVKEDGSVLSTDTAPAQGWLPTSVPSTVVAAQVAAKVFPDPYFGDNLRHLPGMGYPVGTNFSNQPMPQDSPYRCGWWYRTTFTTAPVASRKERVWLHFGGINYRADIWLNGKQIATKDAVAGAYRTYDLDVTDALRPDGRNVLAVETFAPTPDDLGVNWVDWNPAPPDKDMGLWGDVNLVTTGVVTLRSPMAVTHFEDESLHSATLTIYAELHNASDTAVKGVVNGTAAGVRFSQPVELAPHEDRTVTISPTNTPGLRFTNPKPWWPYQMGEPHLEHLQMSFTTSGVTTDQKAIDFGFREITSELTGNGSRLFRVNGKPILIRGAGWSQDMLLRTDAQRLEDQIRMVRDMNLNTIRLEGKLETEDFFRLADKDGILVMLGWCCCDRWEHWASWTPDDLKVAKASLHDQILRLRQHPSLLVWLNGSDNAPPPNVEKAYLQVEADTHWPNPTLSAASSQTTVGAGPDGVKMTGPYDYVAPSYWYVDHRYGGAYGFNTETSPGPAIPSLASRKKFLPDPEAWPPSPTWSLHYGGGEFVKLTAFDNAMAGTYANPQSAADYERMSQTMEYDSERAMYESYSRNKYTSTGVIQWMLNNAWPSMIWHLYDYYLDADAGYFATKKACEPVHIQYSYDDGSVVVVNSTYAPVSGLHASIQVHNLAWQTVYEAESDVKAAPDSSQQVGLVPPRLYSGPDRIFFIDLKLKDAQGNTVSRNFYWVPVTLTTFDWEHTDYTHTPATRYPDLTALTTLPKAEVESSADVQDTPHGREIVVHLKNPSNALAFQVHAAVRTPGDDLVAPVFWSDNWVELTPGESTTLTAVVPHNARGELRVQVDGWNVAPAVLTPSTRASATAPERH